MSSGKLSTLAFLASAILAGCGTPPGVYRVAEVRPSWERAPIPEGEEQFERGRPNALIDGLNHYVISLPTKILLLNERLLDHEFPETSERVLRLYMAMNGLETTKVRHNQYAPVAEWKRLWRNTEVGAGYRFTLGLITWLQYTLVPDRLFAGLPLIGGGDHFNPYSNTINVYSSDLGVLLHEGGHAKDYAQTELKGTMFGLIRLVPGVDLVQEASASRDAIRFLYCIDHPAGELRAYRTLFPAYATYMGSYIPGGTGTIATLGVGHVVGRIKAWRRSLEMRDPTEMQTFVRPPWCIERQPPRGLFDDEGSPSEEID